MEFICLALYSYLYKYEVYKCNNTKNPIFDKYFGISCQNIADRNIASQNIVSMKTSSIKTSTNNKFYIKKLYFFRPLVIQS